jgi:hypothetical protein
MWIGGVAAVALVESSAVGKRDARRRALSTEHQVQRPAKRAREARLRDRDEPSPTSGASMRSAPTLQRIFLTRLHCSRWVASHLDIGTPSR